LYPLGHGSGAKSLPLDSKKILIPGLWGALMFQTAWLIEGVVDRDGRRRSKVRRPTMRAAVEPREAQRPPSLAARTPQAADPR
jgi:hypothetical protein